MEDNDFDVVFENSPLYQHLQDVGFTTADVQPETVCRAQNSTSAKSGAKKKNSSDKQMPLGKTLKKQLEDYVFDESWQNEVHHLCHKTTSQVLEDALKNSALREDDAAYVESFAASLRYEKTEEPSDTIMGQMLTQVGVLGVTMGYGLFRMFYMKSPDLSTCFFFYALDILSVIMTVVALLPATIKFAMAGRLVGRLQRLNDAATSLLIEIHEFQRLVKKSKFFIHESELIKRGFTMVTAPISRLESGLHATVERQCPDLRRAVFHRSRNVTLDFREATIELFKSSAKFTSGSELGDVTKYMSHLALTEYGPCMTLEDADDKKLAAATDNYCLDALKSMVEMMEVHISEFVRVLCLLFLMQGNDYAASVTGFSKQLEVVEWLSKHMKENHRLMKTAYVLHKELEAKMAYINAKDTRHRSKTSSRARNLHLAVHSLRLHLLSAAHRLQPADEQLESVCERGDNDASDSAGDMSCLRIQLTSDLKAIGHDLSACRDCCDELSTHLKRLNGEKDTDTEGIKDDAAGVITSRDVGDGGVIVSVIPDCDPVSEDQVFEGYPDEADDLSENSNQLLLENEERCSQPEAIRVLAELKTVIAVRAEEMLKREEVALLKMDDGRNKKKGRNDEQEVTEGVATPADENLNQLVKSEKPLNDTYSVHSDKTPVNCYSRDLTCTMDTVAMSESTELKQPVNSTMESDHAISTTKYETVSDHPNSIQHDILCDTQESDDFQASAKAFGHVEDRLDSDGNPLDHQSVADASHSFITGLSSSAIARMAVAKSHHMASLNVETFGDDWSDGDVTEDDETA